jgi:hypothetical protein
MSSFAKEREEIAAIKRKWQESAATEESRKLQAQIEEKKKLERLAKKREADLILKRSKRCRAFYQQLYAASREEEKQELVKLSQQISQTRRRHQHDREEEREANDTLAKARAQALHEKVQEVSFEHQQFLIEERYRHAEFYRQERERLAAVREERRKNEHRKLESSIERERQLRDSIHEETLQLTSICNDIVDEVEDLKLEKRRELAEAAAAERKARREENRRARELAQQRHAEREFQHAMERIVRGEEPGRNRLLLEEQEERHEIVRAKASTVSKQYMSEILAAQQMQITSYHSSLTPVPDSSDLLRASERSAQRLVASRKLEAARENAMTQRKMSAQSFRRERLQREKEFLSKEADKAEQCRLRALQRRRGEKLATETEPYRISDSADPSAPLVEDPLPPHLQAVIVDIIRGKIVKDDIDFNVL